MLSTMREHKPKFSREMSNKDVYIAFFQKVTAAVNFPPRRNKNFISQSTSDVNEILGIGENKTD